MLSTMDDAPPSPANLLRYGSTVHADAEIMTWTGTCARRRTFTEIGRRSSALAHALRRLGANGDERVATFCGTTPSTWRHTSQCPRRVRCYTR